MIGWGPQVFFYVPRPGICDPMIDPTSQSDHLKRQKYTDLFLGSGYLGKGKVYFVLGDHFNFSHFLGYSSSCTLHTHIGTHTHN